MVLLQTEDVEGDGTDALENGESDETDTPSKQVSSISMPEASPTANPAVKLDSSGQKIPKPLKLKAGQFPTPTSQGSNSKQSFRCSTSGMSATCVSA